MNNNYNFQFIRMIYIYVPNFMLLFAWLYLVELNIFLSLLLTPISYIVINIGLVRYQHFNLIHGIIDKLIIFRYIENLISTFLMFLVKKLFEIKYVNKLYLLLKVKILVSVFNLIANYIPTEKTNDLTLDLKNDYLEILNRNRQKRQRTASVAITSTELEQELKLD